MQDLIRLRLLLEVFLTFVLLSIVYAVSDKKYQFVSSLVMAMVIMPLTWLHGIFNISILFVLSNILEIIFFVFATSVIVRYILTQNRVTAHLIFAAIIGYMFIGLIWAAAYSLLAHVYPDSLALNPEFVTGAKARTVFTYFSFVTLTTLGYGDVTPLTDRAFALTILEAVVGQIYLTVLIARLVGLHIAHETEKKDGSA